MGCTNCNMNARQEYPNRNRGQMQMHNGMNCGSGMMSGNRNRNYSSCPNNNLRNNRANMPCGREMEKRDMNPNHNVRNNRANMPCGREMEKHDMNPNHNHENRKMDSCPCMKNGCDFGNEHVDKMDPGMAFVPWQKWQDIYDMDEAMEHGTIFKELNKPWRGCQ